MTSTSPLKALIVDDEFAGRMMIANLLMEVLPVVSFHFASSSEEVMLMIKQHRYDMFFLDVNLPGKTGLEIASDLYVLDYEPYIILVSAYERFDWSQQALRLKLFDYLIKPVVVEEFREVMERLLNFLASGKKTRSSDKYLFYREEDEKSLFKVLNGVLALRSTDIVCFEADGSCSMLFRYEEPRPVTVFESMCDIENRLKSLGFIRCGRKYLVNTAYVERLNTKNHTCSLRTHNGSKIIELSAQAFSHLRLIVSDPLNSG